MIKIIVCLKLILDPEIPLSLFKIDTVTQKPVPPAGIPPVFSPFDLNALEAALRLKDQNDGQCTVTMLCLGENIPKAIIQKALAMGADEAVILDDAAFDDLDPYSTAHCLAAGIRKIGRFDLICTGRQAADWDNGIVWAGIAHHLDLPCVSIARKAEIADDKLIVERCVSDGIEILETDLPALATFSSEVGEPRFASLKTMMAAKKKPITKWNAADINFQSTECPDPVGLTPPPSIDIDCCFIEGSSDEEKGQKLAQLLRTFEEANMPGTGI